MINQWSWPALKSLHAVSAGKGVGMGSSLTLLMGMQHTVWTLLRKPKTEWPRDPAILLLGRFTDKTVIQKDA